MPLFTKSILELLQRLVLYKTSAYTSSKAHPFWALSGRKITIKEYISYYITVVIVHLTLCMCKISPLSVYGGIQKINTCAKSQCDGQNSIYAFARIVFSIFILGIFSIILTFEVSLINTVIQNIFSHYQTTQLSRALAKYHYG